MKFARVLENIHRTIHRQWAVDGARIGLSHSEFEYLRAIKDREAEKICGDNHGQHLQDVVAAMGIKKASASAMIVKLEKRGLVERIPCRLDARAQHILLTKKGLELLGVGEKVYEAAAGALRSEFGDRKIEERTDTIPLQRSKG
ncbi:MAG: MarR family transcriptional regulator [Hyphomicrobiales bacterium]|nr:MarR family transcriptional regulator [Hyphomicrobiales bacterium]MCP4999111.1 MarR family transcriptional regulator [Hyphomicrobiales bacterium]